VADRSVPRPLAARTDLAPAPRTPARPRPGRLRRFARRYGWRAYALPLLTIATIVALLDLAFSPPAPADSPSATGAATTSSVAPPSAAASAGAPTGSLDSDRGPTDAPPTLGSATFVQKGAGTVSVVPGTSKVYGSGPLRRFVVETENGIGVDGPAFAAAVERTLSDSRSWGHGGQMSFQRVDGAQFDFKVTLVSPGNMETYCPGVGTGGYTSCRYGPRAVINLARWETAVPDYQGDIATYRLYVVNHEVGHALGHHHEQCPGVGQVAPVMQQQTLGLKGCLKNAWPYP
jgi:hypothetical protein